MQSHGVAQIKLVSTLVLLSLGLLLAAANPAPAAQPAAPPANGNGESEFSEEALQLIMKPWAGDMEGMLKRRVIRALVAFSKTNYFLDGATKRGITYELLTQFEKHLNKVLKTRHLKVHIILIPVPRDKLIPYLVEGKGDLAAAGLTETSVRRKEVDFGAPFATDVSEVVVTGPGAPPIKGLDDLSGKAVYVRKSSSYHRSLEKLNKRFKKEGKAPVEIQAANEYLETEDILEMTNAGLVKITVADQHIASFWAQIFKKIKVHDQVAVRTGGRVAWAIRKNCPKLKAAIDGFVKKTKKGTLLGNILLKRYFQDTKWARQALTEEDMQRFDKTVQFFQKYSDQYGFDYLMVTALAYQESGLDQSKKSPVGAVGIMQILPSTAAGPPVLIPDVHKLERNIQAGTKYLRFIYDEYYKNDKDVDELNKVLFTFASYNAGPARVAGLRKRAAKMGLNPNVWFHNVEVAAARVIGRETVQYVSNIFKYYIAYKQITEQRQHREKLMKKKMQ